METVATSSCNPWLSAQYLLEGGGFPTIDDHGLASPFWGAQGMVHRRNRRASVAAQTLAVRDIAALWLPVRVDLEELVHKRFESEGE